MSESVSDSSIVNFKNSISTKLLSQKQATKGVENKK
jgi:hypothetical protein